VVDCGLDGFAHTLQTVSIFEVNNMVCCVWLKIWLIGKLGEKLATFGARLRKVWWISEKKILATLTPR
jgi:hypothetical protein